MPLFSNQQNQAAAVWEPQVAEGRLAKTAGASPSGVFTQSSGIVGVSVDVKNHIWGEHATDFLATGTAIRLPETSPKPTFTLGLDS
jgi:hypothetical protein